MFQPDVALRLGTNIGMVLPLRQHDLDRPGRATSVALSAYPIFYFESEVDKLSDHSVDLMMFITNYLLFNSNTATWESTAQHRRQCQQTIRC